MRVRVVTLNLLHGAPIPGGRHARVSLETRLAWTSQRLAEESPDIVLLQEASASARQENTAAILARHLRMAYVYARANPSPLVRRAGWGWLSFEEGPTVRASSVWAIGVGCCPEKIRESSRRNRLMPHK
jgi:endonuclease/exonuclease/phosphatase family metal-dependent hydrolase